MTFKPIKLGRLGEFSRLIMGKWW